MKPSALQPAHPCARTLRLRLRALLMVGVISASGTTALADQNPTPDHSASHGIVPTTQKTQPFWAQRLTGRFRNRDGLQLTYSALLPKGKGPFPVIVNYSGYDPAAIGSEAYLHGDTAMSTNMDKTFVEAGYAVVGVNARGTGCSEGSFQFLPDSYGRDGSDAIEFIATQPWSNGKVGMAYFSWAGMSQLATAAERPAHLAAIAPGMVFGDIRDGMAPGGVTVPGVLWGWWGFLMSRWENVRLDAVARNDEQCLKQVTANFKTAPLQAPHKIMLQHPLRDAYVNSQRLADKVGNITVPVLAMTAFQDQVVTSRDGHYQDNVQPDKLWVVQTNGPHDMYVSLRFREKLLRFFDRFVKDKRNGFDSEPRVELWYETAKKPGEVLSNPHASYGEHAIPGFVVKRPSYPTNTRVTRFMLGNQGTLLNEATATTSEPSAYAFPVNSVEVNAGLGPDSWGALPADFPKGTLAFTTSPLTQTLVTYGAASADLWISATQLDTDIQVTLTEVRADGQEVFAQRGWLRVSNRALDEKKSTPTRPSILDRADILEPLIPDVPVLARVELPNFAHAFRAGSRIRLWIDTPSTSGFLTPAPLFMPSQNKLWHDSAHPSSLALAVLDNVAVPATPPACGTVLKQPCRPDPWASLTTTTSTAR